MKKSTKKTIMALAIVLIFGLSSIAFFFTGLTGYGTQQTQAFKPLATNVVEGKLSEQYKQTYVQNGYTWIEFYYDPSESMYASIADQLPAAFTTPSGQPQIVVQKINESYANESMYFVVTSNNGIESLSGNETDKMLDVLCRLLSFPPIECGLQNIMAPINETEINTEINSTLEVNQTVNTTANSTNGTTRK
jgi:hypothetical protein